MAQAALVNCSMDLSLLDEVHGISDLWLKEFLFYVNHLYRLPTVDSTSLYNMLWAAYPLYHSASSEYKCAMDKGMKILKLS